MKPLLRELIVDPVLSGEEIKYFKPIRSSRGSCECQIVGQSECIYANHPVKLFIFSVLNALNKYYVNHFQDDHHGQECHHGRDDYHGQDGYRFQNGQDGQYGRDGHHGHQGHHGRHLYHIQEQTGQTDVTFKLDFPGNLCRAAFAILAMS